MPIPAAYRSLVNASTDENSAATKPLTLNSALSAASEGARMPAGSLGQYGDRLTSAGVPFTNIYNTNPQAQLGGKGGVTPTPPQPLPQPPPQLPPRQGKGGFQMQPRPMPPPPPPPAGGKGGVGGPATPRTGPTRIGPAMLGPGRVGP